MRKEAVFVATQLTEAVSTNQRIDDSEFENFNGQLVRRPAPKEEHADYQFLLVDLLDAIVKPLGGKARQKWSISDDAGHWPTPDVTVALPGFKRQKSSVDSSLSGCRSPVRRPEFKGAV